MEQIYPDFYYEFRCVAGECPDSCCHEWDVQVDQASAARFRGFDGELGETLKQYLYEEDGEYYLRNVDGRCPMWRQDGLCRIQAEHGHEALCRVCRQFPRLRQDYGTFVELGLELSCPEAARIMLTRDTWQLRTETVDGGEEPDYDPEVMAILRSSRPGAMELLRNSAFSVRERLALLLMYGYHIQGQIDGAEAAPFDPEAALAEARQFAGEGNGQLILDFCAGLEILTDRWKEILSRTPDRNWSEMLCKLAEHWIYRYYYQAVSDYDLVCRVKFTVAGCIVAALVGGREESALLAMIQLYSKEIENNGDNVEAILDGAYTAPALTDANLLGLLLG